MDGGGPGAGRRLQRPGGVQVSQVCWLWLVTGGSRILGTAVRRMTRTRPPRPLPRPTCTLVPLPLLPCLKPPSSPPLSRPFLRPPEPRHAGHDELHRLQPRTHAEPGGQQPGHEGHGGLKPHDAVGREGGGRGRAVGDGAMGWGGTLLEGRAPLRLSNHPTSCPSPPSCHRPVPAPTGR